MDIKTVSLETARALKNAGFRQDTDMFWYTGYEPKENKWPTKASLKNQSYIHHNSGWAAPTTDEILDEIPKRLCPFTIQKTDRLDNFSIGFGGYGFWCEYLGIHMYFDKSLPDCLAKMYLWLKQQKLI